MNDLRRLWIAVPALILLLILLALYQTRSVMEYLPSLQRGAGSAQGLVDQSPWLTASTLAARAVSAEEQDFARDAERLADSEVDNAFSMALNEPTNVQRHPLTGEALKDSQLLDDLNATMEEDKKVLAAAADDDDKAEAQAKLDADTAYRDDVKQDLARASGDRRPAIEEEQTAWNAAEKRSPNGGEGAIASVSRHSTLWGRMAAWLDQRDRAAQLATAEVDARHAVTDLTAKHQVMETEEARAEAAATGALGTARVKALNESRSRRQAMGFLDQRVQSEGELADVYAKWQKQVWLQHRIITHLILESLAWVMAILLAATVVKRMAIDRLTPDNRKQQTLERLFTLLIQVISAVAVLIVVFGVPEHLTTILGLATAGLTVVFQDFILAFFGWFVLMGRNGIRVCDWVEINGTGGEVSEIGLFRTTLLETGNWTSRGHPTGRKVTFTNSFAIRGTYFNYTTHGQWMWDEIVVTVGAGAWDVMDKLLAAVQAEAAIDTEEAEGEWKKALGRVGLGNFTAAPTVDLRPAASGMDVVVRFVTKAGSRFDRRNHIYQQVMKILRESSGQAGNPSAPKLET